MTTIGFELGRRNIRMILDRSPEKETLMPLEKTRIRLEMVRIKEKIDWVITMAHDSGLPGNADQNVVSNLSHTL